MIFTADLWTQIVLGTKTETRRLVRPAEELRHDLQPGVEYPIAYVYDVQNERVKWMVGRRYGIQPGRGKRRAAGLIELTAIRGQMLQDINQLEARAEGMLNRNVLEPDAPMDFVGPFHDLWDRLYRRPGTRWEDNPRVWVLGFRYVPPLFLSPAV